MHPSRLPLGGGWTGHCSAPGYQGVLPSEQEIRELCNLGYASHCPRLPKERPYDAVRFSVVRDNGSQLFLWFVCEAAHLPAEHGKLEYDLTVSRWVSPHADPRIQKMADCFLQSYLLRRSPSSTLELIAKMEP